MIVRSRKRKAGMSNIRCSFCGGRHPVDLCNKTWGGSSNVKNLRCSFCGSNQHTIDYCPKTYSGESNRRSNPNGDYLDR